MGAHFCYRAHMLARLLPFALLLVSCAGAGPWGHAPEYAPLPGEEQAVEGARDLDLVMAQREPQEWTREPVRFFGVVIKGKSGDPALLDVGVRALAPRNLCDAPESESCRVTVTDKNFGTLRVSLQMTAEEKTSMTSGSLLRIVGMLKPDEDGKLMAVATWHRHWPRGHYVTESFRQEMRR
jgi:hypothetical protein